MMPCTYSVDADGPSVGRTLRSQGQAVLAHISRTYQRTVEYGVHNTRTVTVVCTVTVTRPPADYTLQYTRISDTVDVAIVRNSYADVVGDLLLPAVYSSICIAKTGKHLF